MQHPRRISILLLGWLALFFLAAGHDRVTEASSLVYKNYIIRYDRGWDILCEPYVVREGDWVLKIFRQKGEIAHQDFRDFLGIFQRLNPHVRDINMVRPGQGIDIPLRKLEHGALSGQASGVVTIPFVTLTEVKEVIKEHSETYQVRRGDTVSKLIARKYGGYGSPSYQEGIKLFQAANPHVKNLDLIYTGQKVYLPDPAIREQSFYAAMYDEQGNLRQTVSQGGGTAAGLVAPPASSGPPAEAPVGPAVPQMPAGQPVTPLSAPSISQEEPQSALHNAAAIVGGELRDKGTYYLPRQGQEDFEIDLSRHPVLQLPDGAKVAFTPGSRIMEMDRRRFEADFPDIKTVPLNENTSSEQIVASIFEALEESGKQSSEVAFEGQGVHVAVRSRWTRPETDGRHLCITPIGGPQEQTPESIRRFLEQNGIVLQEMMPGGGAAPLNSESQRHAVKNILALTFTSPREFVKSLAKALGFAYAANTGITFPYAGIQVQAYADLVSAGNGRETLVDFGDLYGDAVAAISQTGLNVVQISAGQSYRAIAEKLLAALSLPFEVQPAFLAARRPPRFNTTITVPGILYTPPDGRRILITGFTPPSAVTDLISAQGIDMVVW